MVAGADYGSREAFLGKRVDKEYVPQAQSAMDYTLIFAGIFILLILAIAYLVWDKMKGKAKKR